MVKKKDRRNFFNGRKEVVVVVVPVVVPSAIDDVAQSELLLVENEIKKSRQVKSPAGQMSQKISKQGF